MWQKSIKIIYAGIFAMIGIIVAQTFSILYGIHALVPSGPFKERNYAVGITLLVLSMTGPNMIVGAIGGLIIAGIIYLPYYLCIKISKDC